MARSDDDDFEDDDLEDSAPPAKTSMLTIVLCFLNVAAAVGFAMLLVLDFGKRQEWSYLVFLHDLAIDGLPLEEEGSHLTASRETRPSRRLTPEQLKAAFARRGQRAKEEFQPVDEVFPNGILPEHLTDEILKEVFKDVGPPVRTLEEEINRIKKELPGDIEKAAQKVVEETKTEADKRSKIASLLLPLASTTFQIDTVDKKIQDTPAAKLDELLADATQRRMLIDVLAPLEVQRPAHLRSRDLENAAEVDKVKLKDLIDLFNLRLEAAVKADHIGAVFYDEKEWGDKKRDSIDKRSAIALTLFTVAQARKPDGKLLYENGIERARVVLGWHEFALAAQTLTRSLETLSERVVQAVRQDRQGHEVDIKAEHYRALVDYYLALEKNNANNKAKVDQAQERMRLLDQIKDKVGPAYNAGFTQQQQQEIHKIAEMNAAVLNRKARLSDLQDQLKKQETIRADRKVHLDQTLVKLVQSRSMTAKEQAKVRALQEELFLTARELKDADETNLKLEQEIRRLEGVKGGRTP